MSRQAAGKRRAEISRRRNGKKPDKSGWGRHGLLFGNQRVRLSDDEFLMAASPTSVCGRKKRNHRMVWNRALGHYRCANLGCPANC